MLHDRFHQLHMFFHGLCCCCDFDFLNMKHWSWEQQFVCFCSFSICHHCLFLRFGCHCQVIAIHSSLGWLVVDEIGVNQWLHHHHLHDEHNVQKVVFQWHWWQFSHVAIIVIVIIVIIFVVGGVDVAVICHHHHHHHHHLLCCGQKKRKKQFHVPHVSGSFNPNIRYNADKRVVCLFSFSVHHSTACKTVCVDCGDAGFAAERALVNVVVVDDAAVAAASNDVCIDPSKSTNCCPCNWKVCEFLLCRFPLLLLMMMTSLFSCFLLQSDDSRCCCCCCVDDDCQDWLSLLLFLPHAQTQKTWCFFRGDDDHEPSRLDQQH